MKLAVIPARGGSKRIEKKNIKLFCGEPIISFSIKAALESGCFDRVIVSTDNDEIADVSKAYGAEVLFIRPDSLSGDYIGTIPVIAHAINWMDKYEGKVDFACCLYATAPLIRIQDLRRGLSLLKSNCLSYVFSATKYTFPIQRAIKIREDLRVEMFDSKYFNVRSQDLEQAWHDAGQFYWGRADAWKSEKIIFSQDSGVIELPSYLVQDIDTVDDWKRAELLFELLSFKGG